MTFPQPGENRRWGEWWGGGGSHSKEAAKKTEEIKSLYTEPPPRAVCKKRQNIAYNSVNTAEISAVDPDGSVYVQKPSGSGSVFGIRIRIHTCKYTNIGEIRGKMCNIFNINSQYSETKLSKNFFR